MAGKYGSASGWAFVDEFNIILSKIQELSFKITSITEPSHGIGDTWEENTPVGLCKAEITMKGGYFDTQTGYMHDASEDELATTPQTAVRVLTFGFAGQTIGLPFIGFEGVHEVDYEVLGAVGKLTRANATHIVSGEAEQGVIIRDTGTAMSDGEDTESSGVDNTTVVGNRPIPITSSSVANPTHILCPIKHGLTSGDTVLIAGHTGSTPDINGEEAVTVVDEYEFTVAQNVTVGGTGGTFTKGKTNAGATAFLHILALALGGYTDVTITIRDSADDITYGDLVAFTAASAVGAERKTVAGAVERYLACSVAFSGAGADESVTFFAGVARK